MTNKALSQHTSHIFIRSLVRVNAHASDQTGWSIKHLLAHIALALLRSLPLRSFLSIKVSFLLFVSDDDSPRDHHPPRQGESSNANTKFGSSFSRAFKTVLAFTARFGRGYLSSSTRVASFFQSLAERREVLSFSLVFSTCRESSVTCGKKKIETFFEEKNRKN